MPEDYGELELDFRYNAVIGEEITYAGSAAGITLQSDIVADYLLNYGSEDQKREWLPRMVAGEAITAIAITEPSTGSDLLGHQDDRAARGHHYVVNGSKTYITNGQNADLIVVVVAKTDPAKGAKGISLILVEATREGLARGRNLDKIGQHSADTSELFFEDVRVPITNCLGREGAGFVYLMQQLPQERLGIAIAAQASAQRSTRRWPLPRSESRSESSCSIFRTQGFALATLAAKLQVGWAHVHWAITRHVAGELTAVEASAAKLFHTELQWECCDQALQLHGGAEYMKEYPIARIWRDARVGRIYGGINEIMREVIGRSL